MIAKLDSKPDRGSFEPAVVSAVSARASTSPARLEGATFSPRFFRLKKILVPVDFSESSKVAVKYATQVAGMGGGRTILLHVVSPRKRRDRRRKPVSKEFSRLDDAERRLLELGQHELGKTAMWDFLVETGKPDREIVNAAKALGVDLIVMATCGRNGRKHAFDGATAERLVRNAPCPLLVLHEKALRFGRSPAKEIPLSEILPKPNL
jgi:universal stress protein A